MPEEQLADSFAGEEEIEINQDLLEAWGNAEAFLNDLIHEFERGSVRTETSVDLDGNVSYSIPDEAAISTRGYAMAETAEVYADGASGALNLVYAQRVRSDSKLEADLRGAAQDLRDDAGDDFFSEMYVTGSPVSKSVTSSELLNKLPGVDVIKKNEVIKWFSDCYRCETRLSLTLNNDFTLPEILLDLADLIGELDSIIDTALAAFDWTKFLAQICPLLSVGTWCIPDLVAFLTMLASLMNQYWLVDPLLQFDWWGIVASLLFPVLQMLYTFVSTGLNASIAPITCIGQMIDDIRSVFEATSNLDASAGLSLGHLQSTIYTAPPAQDPGFSEEVLRRFSGKSDWVSGDTLIDYSEIINFLNPGEVAKLALVDFDFKLRNLSEWLASRIAVLKTQSRNTLLSTLKFTNVLLAVGRLYSFFRAIIELISEGKAVCTEEKSETGQSQFIPTTTLQNLFAGTGFIPEWVRFEEAPPLSTTATAVSSGSTRQNRPESFTIIDSSIGVTSTIMSCFGRLSQEEALKVQEWMDELDGFSG